MEVCADQIYKEILQTTSVLSRDSLVLGCSPLSQKTSWTRLCLGQFPLGEFIKPAEGLEIICLNFFKWYILHPHDVEPAFQDCAFQLQRDRYGRSVVLNGKFV